MPAMTSAEFRILREQLGVTTDWLAEQFGVDHRTVRRWDTGASRVPDGVAADMDRIRAATDDFVDQVASEVVDADQEQLVVYRDEVQFRESWPGLNYPAGWHRAAIGRVAAETGIRIVFAGESTADD